MPAPFRPATPYRPPQTSQVQFNQGQYVSQQVGQSKYQQYSGQFFQYQQPAVDPPPQFVNQQQGNHQAAAKKRKKKKNPTTPVLG
jgi:hypothetical protein